MQSLHISSDTVLIYMAGYNFWEGLFDNEDIKFLKNTLQSRLVTVSHLFVTIITPAHISKEQHVVLKQKQDTLAQIAHRHGASIEFYLIRGRSISSLLKSRREIRKSTAGYAKRIIWAMNYFNTLLGTLVKRSLPATTLHFSMQGLASEEERLYSDSIWISRMIKWVLLEAACRFSLAHSDTLSTVSKRFKEYVENNYGTAASPVFVLPCFFDASAFFFDEKLRSHYRRRLRIEPRQTLLLFSGKLFQWQLPDALFGFFKRVQGLDTKKDFRFMVLTHDREKAHALAKRYGIRDILIDAVSGEELNGIYNAADIGIATRSPDWVSKVSSPVKIPEYLATRNSVIMLESIGDFGVELRDKPYVLVKENERKLLETTISQIQDLSRPTDEDLEMIRQRFSIHSNMPVVREIFARHLS